MAIPQINSFDHFYVWREKTNLIANLIGDVETINLSSTDRDSVIEALNKIISNIGTLSSLSTTVKTSIVAAINEHQTKIGTGSLTTIANTLMSAVNELDGEHGTLSSLTTTAKNTLVAAINEVSANLLIGNAVFTVGSETGNVIRVGVQLKNRTNSNVSSIMSVQAYLSDQADGSTIVSTSPNGGWAIGNEGVLIPLIENKIGTFITNNSGFFNIDITESGIANFYLIVILPLGNLKISSIVSFL